MLYLKQINYEDSEKEYAAIVSIPEYENGVENPYFDCSKEEFINEIIPLLIDQFKGKRYYEKAYETANRIISDYQKHRKEYYEFVSYYFNKLLNQ